MTLGEIELLLEKGDSVLLEKTVSKPYEGSLSLLGGAAESGTTQS